MNPCFTYARDNGLAYSSDYPYTARDGICYANSITPIPGFRTTGYKNVTRNDPKALESAIANNGPAVIAVMANN